MNRKERRASNANGRKLQRKEWNEFVDKTEEMIKYAEANGGGL